MLVLSRKIDDAVVIGSNVRIKVLGVKGQTVRLGIEAPRHVHVRREEIPLQKTENQDGENQPR